jgi:hypothetical protein
MEKLPAYSRIDFLNNLCKKIGCDDIHDLRRQSRDINYEYHPSVIKSALGILKNNKVKRRYRRYIMYEMYGIVLTDYSNKYAERPYLVVSERPTGVPSVTITNMRERNWRKYSRHFRKLNLTPFVNAEQMIHYFEN